MGPISRAAVVSLQHSLALLFFSIDGPGGADTQHEHIVWQVLVRLESVGECRSDRIFPALNSIAILRRDFASARRFNLPMALERSIIAGPSRRVCYVEAYWSRSRRYRST